MRIWLAFGSHTPISIYFHAEIHTNRGIYQMLEMGRKFREIGRELNRNHGTISKFVSRNSHPFPGVWRKMSHLELIYTGYTGTGIVRLTLYTGTGIVRLTFLLLLLLLVGGYLKRKVNWIE
jgi:hypothetical protein